MTSNEAMEKGASLLGRVYRTVYDNTGRLLRRLIPAGWHQALKRVVPVPNSIWQEEAWRQGKVARRQALLEKFTRNVAAQLHQCDFSTSTTLPDVIILSSVDWDSSVLGPQYVARGLAEGGRRVFYLEMGMVEALQVKEVEAGVLVVRLAGEDVGFMPSHRGKPTEAETVHWLKAFWAFCDQAGMSAFKQVIVEHPFWWQLVRHLPPEFQVIYDRLGEVAGLPGTDLALKGVKEELASHCDLLIEAEDKTAGSLSSSEWQQRSTRMADMLCVMPKVSVVVLAYGNPELTCSLIYSLYAGGATYPNMEVLIVDNGSPSEAVEMVKEYVADCLDVVVIENGENLGFAKGNNIGLKAASGDYVMLLNNDTMVAPGAIYAMVRHLSGNPQIGVVGPLTNSIANEAKIEVEYDNFEGMKKVAWLASLGYRGVFTSIHVVAYFAVMFRRVDLQLFGLLSEEYGCGMFEDDDHCAVIRSKGYICALAEDAYVHHYHSAAFSKMDSARKKELFEQNKKKFEAKWGAWQPHNLREKRPEASLVLSTWGKADSKGEL